jgi:hypothetical protein
MTDSEVLRKDQLEIRLHNEKKLIHEGALKDDNPLDVSEGFRQLCDACRKGDLKVCQEKISEGVNINARDSYDYTPLILVRASICIWGTAVYRHLPRAELIADQREGQPMRAFRGCGITSRSWSSL